MARDAVISCLRRSENIGGGDGGGGGGGLESTPSVSDDVHVLAVDDSLVDRKVIERLLRISSCKVTAVDSGWRALQFLGLDQEKGTAGFDKLKVDLIITDYCMPGMTGYELLKKIKESSSFREIPVVIMSSENVLARIDSCLEEGAEDFLLKPVKLADVERLRNYMTKDITIANSNKRKYREDPCNVSSPPSSPIPSPSPPPPLPPSSTSPEPSDSSRSSSPSEIFSSSPPSPAKILSSQPPSPTKAISSSPPFPADSLPFPEPLSPPPPMPMDSPTTRQRMTSPGLD